MSTPQHQPTVPPSGEQSPDWKRQLAERLDAYRSKHPDTAPAVTLPSHANADSRASKIARSVASRYAAAPTYSQLLAAAEAERIAAAEEQVKLAEQAAREARVAQEKIAEEELAAHGAAASREEASAPEAPPTEEQQAWAPAIPVMPQFAARNQEMHVQRPALEPEPTLEDLWASALVEPRALLPSKLIEFPRELVSSRRARPRLPEIPEPETVQAEAAQLRIFEVQPEAAAPADSSPQSGTPVSESNTEMDSSLAEAATVDASNDAMRDRTEIQNETLPAAPARMISGPSVQTGSTGTPRQAISCSHADVTVGRASNSSSARAFKSLEWAAISLDKEPAVRPQSRESSVAEFVPFLVEPASIDRRLMAFAVDFALVTAGFLGFLAVFAAATPHLPTGLTAVVLGGAVYASLWLLYQMLFFSLSGATAGMLYARIALCTFDDQNPTREALRRRLAAWWLSCLPLGMGFLWCFVDEDNLSWHDRMTRMYQRSY